MLHALPLLLIYANHNPTTPFTVRNQGRWAGSYCGGSVQPASLRRSCVVGIAKLHDARLLAIAARRRVGGDTVGNVPQRHVLVRNRTELALALNTGHTKRNEKLSWLMFSGSV